MKASAFLLALGIVVSASPAFATPKDECINAAEAAQRLRTQRKLMSARAQLVACAADSCPSVIRDDCVKWLGEVDAAMPTIVIRAHDGRGHDVVDVRVLVDGTETMTRLTGVATPINPGEHTFRFESARHPAVEQTVLVAEAEKTRVIQIAFDDPSHPVVAVLPAAPPSPIAPPPSAPSAKPSIVPWIIGGIGVASLVGFGVLEGLLQGEYSDLESGCGAHRGCTDADVSGNRTKVTLAKVTLGVGLAGVVVAVPWILLDRRRTARRSAYVDFTPLPGGGAGVLGGRF